MLRPLVVPFALILLLSACTFDRSGYSADEPDARAVDTLTPDMPADLDIADSAVPDSDGPPDKDPPPDAAADTGSPINQPFGTPVPVTDLNDVSAEDDPSLTGDMLEIFFDSNRSGGLGAGEIWTATRASLADPWSTPVPVVELNSVENDSTPEVSADGLTLYFASARPGGAGLEDIYVSTRPSRSAPWNAPLRVPELSSSSMDYAPVASSDARFIVFSSLRPGVGSADLYYASRPNSTDPWDTPVLFTDLNTTHLESDGWINEAKTIVYFTSDRPGGTGSFDFWVATRPHISVSFSPPTPVVELNSSGLDNDLWLSSDLRTVYFSSDRGGDLDLYMATR